MTLLIVYSIIYLIYFPTYSLIPLHLENSYTLLIFCDYENMKTYFNFNGENKTMPKFTSSTNLVLNYINNLS